MTDCFELLGEPRRPWLDAEALKSRFLVLSAEAHPDRVHGGTDAERAEANSRSADLNAAFNTLREPRDRLFHLLELELGARPRDIQRIPPGTMDLFVEIGQACRDVDAFLAVPAPADQAPMLRLQRMKTLFGWSDRLMSLQAKVNTMRDTLDAAVKELNPAWESAPSAAGPERRAALPLDRLEELSRSMSYVTRWTSQIQERLSQLAA
jgi:curved DNA-binding protein CbpA